MLTSNRKILHVNKGGFSDSIDLAVVNKYGKRAVTQISKRTGNVYHAACRRVL